MHPPQGKTEGLPIFIRLALGGAADPWARLRMGSEVHAQVMEDAAGAPVLDEERRMRSPLVAGGDAPCVDPVSIPVNDDYAT